MTNVVPIVTKTCGSCGEKLPLSSFHKNKANRDGYMTRCASCRAVTHSRYQKENRAQYTIYARKHRASKMGISVLDIDAWYEKQLALQGGRCAMPDCRTLAENSYGGRLDMDHDLQTDKFRALLCRSCNTKLGIYEKRKMVFETYVKAHRRGR
jgi:hypothetical protein